MRSLGIDVGVRKGLDLVLLDERLQPLATDRHVPIDALGDLIDRLRPDVVAIDSPPAWGKAGGCRKTELALRALGIQSYGTPSDPKRSESPFYEWMRIGFEAFRTAESRGFPRYRAGAVARTALEVFPHATAVVLAGALPPTGMAKREWRTEVLQKAGVSCDELGSLDQIDAALAALTGLFALRGEFTAPGDPDEGVIAVPVSALPERALRRSVREPAPEFQSHLPGLKPCACGDPRCVGVTAREFAPGHDAKRKAILWRLAREGERAAEEIRGRGWKLPPEMR